MEKIYATPLKNYLTSNGFVAVSNLLLDNQQQLGLTEGELLFIIKVLRHKDGFVLNDKVLDSSVSSKTLSRRRNSLKEKGYLNFTVVKKQDENGLFSTMGISYDFSKLEEKLQALSDKNNEKIQKEAQKEVEKLDTTIVVDKVDENEKSPLEHFKKDYENYYGVPYILSEYEIKHYNELKEQHKIMVSYIFKFCYEKNLLKTITPRLSLFFKTPFRFKELKDYCIENGFIQEEEFIPDVDKEDLEIKANIELEINKIFSKYYKHKTDNRIFHTAVERYVNRYYNREKKEMPDISHLVDKSYIDNKKYEA